jgi:cold shock CspA family protein
MRLQGKIVSWNDDRGFGFVEQNSTEEKAFVHVSAIANRQRRPVVGDLVTYQVVSDKRGPKAVEVRYVGEKAVSSASTRNGRRTLASKINLGTSIVFLLFLVSYAYKQIAGPRGGEYESTIERIAPIDVEQPVLPAFSCTPRKTRCTEMRSCDEALYHQDNCGVTTMDGDRDGIPCEDQHCDHLRR